MESASLKLLLAPSPGAMWPALGSTSRSGRLFGVLTLLLCPSSLHGCSSPPRIRHGSYKVITKFLGLSTTVQYKCQEGYALVGTATLSCKLFRWSSPAPQCAALCLKPRIPNGKLSVERDQYITPDTLTIQCDPGYKMVGSQVISCSQHRSWIPAVPKCKRVNTAPSEVLEHEEVLEGQHLLECLPDPGDSKMALELHKLSLRIETLEQERAKGIKYI